MAGIFNTKIEYNNLVKRQGKVRDVYSLSDKIFIVATDRISAFDCVFNECIEYKGAVLNMLASYMLDQTEDICKNWKLQTLHPMVTVGKKCEPVKLEVIVRGYLLGSAYREYKQGKREISGVSLDDNLNNYHKFTEPIVTPTTKADAGHDENISFIQAINNNLITKNEADFLKNTALKLFKRGQDLAEKRGLILADTKYEFGRLNDEIILIDEIHTPDSSRYFYKDDFDNAISENREPKQLSKEFLRQYLLNIGFNGNGEIPKLDENIRKEVSDKYLELYEILTGKNLKQEINKELLTEDNLQQTILNYLNSVN